MPSIQKIIEEEVVRIMGGGLMSNDGDERGAMYNRANIESYH